MNYSEAMSFIHSVEWQGSRPGLERITELSEMMNTTVTKSAMNHRKRKLIELARE